MPPTKSELRDSFVEDIQRIYNLYYSLSKHATNSETLVLAEQTVVSMTVSVESFISEILVTLISEDSKLFLTNQSQEMKNTLLKAGYSHLKVQYLANENPKRLKTEELREFILDDGDNLAFPETRKLREFVNKNLPKGLAFTVTDDDEVFIDLLKSTRNLCAHHSQKAARTLNGMQKNYFHNPKIKEAEVCRALVQEEDITVKSLGDYLKKDLSDLGCKNRIEFICNYLRDMVFRWIR